MNKAGGYALALVTATLLGLAGTYYLYYQDAIDIDDQSFAEKQAALLPNLSVLLPPDSQQRHPAALLFHGCGGVKPSLQRRAQEFVERGYAAVIVDSFTGRQIDWRRVCDGRELHGDQRAADVLVALEFARNHPAIDADRLFLVGYSHGAWTILESLAYGDALPRGLADAPATGLAGVQGLVAWYPYCGFASRFRKGWQSELPVLMLLAAEDEITDPEPCATIAAEQASRGEPVSWQVYDGVSHGFDTGEDWVVISNPAVHRQALQDQFYFLAHPRN